MFPLTPEDRRAEKMFERPEPKKPARGAKHGHTGAFADLYAHFDQVLDKHHGHQLTDRDYEEQFLDHDGL